MIDLRKYRLTIPRRKFVLPVRPVVLFVARVVVGILLVVLGQDRRPPPPFNVEKVRESKPGWSDTQVKWSVGEPDEVQHEGDCDRWVYCDAMDRMEYAVQFAQDGTVLWTSITKQPD